MRQRAEQLSAAPLLGLWSSVAIAHDGGVVGILAFGIGGSLLMGGIAGMFSGWLNRPWTVCLGSALAGCAALVIGLELLTDSAIAKNFWSNVSFLAPLAGLPLVLAYLVTHFIGAGLRRRATISQMAPNSTVEADARKNRVRGSL